MIHPAEIAGATDVTSAHSTLSGKTSGTTSTGGAGASKGFHTENKHI